jgi:hypothetical protein
VWLKEIGDHAPLALRAALQRSRAVHARVEVQPNSKGISAISWNKWSSQGTVTSR